MGTDKFDIHIYAHWQGMEDPQKMGILSAHYAKGRKSFSFEYDKVWINSRANKTIDSDLHFFSGVQYPNDKENFGFIFDSMPDTWGRTLMKRRNIQLAKISGEIVRNLNEIDYLLGVYDESRMGALRFKTDEKGPFLDYNVQFSTPPWASVRELQHASLMLENDDIKPEEENKWLNMLIAPGSSLGGARPKANILDENNELWIAKFPSKNDEIDKGAWEFVAYQLALKAGIEMAECKIEKLNHRQHTFFTKRFDRYNKERIHFASAMTMIGKNEELLKTQPASYLDIANFIQNNASNVNENLMQLWRRVAFNIAIYNTDDHLRNHGFILKPQGWILSPAFDLNPSIDKDHLALNINLENSELDIEIVKSVGSFFRLDSQKMDEIITQINSATSQWKNIAKSTGISRTEIQLMHNAFRVL